MCGRKKEEGHSYAEKTTVPEGNILPLLLASTSQTCCPALVSLPSTTRTKLINQKHGSKQKLFLSMRHVSMHPHASTRLPPLAHTQMVHFDVEFSEISPFRYEIKTGVSECVVHMSVFNVRTILLRVKIWREKTVTFFSTHAQ